MRNIIVVTFTEPSKAYQALSTMKTLDESGRLSLHAAAVVEVEASGEPVVRDYADRMPLVTGPHGLIDRMIKGLIGADEKVAIATHITVGSTGMMAEVGEYAVEVVDGAMGQLGGTVYRESAEDVKAAFKTAEQARRASEDKDWQAGVERNRLANERASAERHNERIDRVEQRLERMERWLEGQKKPLPGQTHDAAQPAASASAAGE